MDTTTHASPPAAAPPAAELAKAALRRLVANKLDPTPENYARAYRAETGPSAPAGLPERAEPVLGRLVAAAAPEAADVDRQVLTQALREGRWEAAERALASLADGERQAAALAGLIERIVRGVERGGRQWTSGRRKESLHRVLSGTRIDAHLLQRRLTQLLNSWDGDNGDSASMPLSSTEGDDAAPDHPEAAQQAAAAWQCAVASLAGSVQKALPAAESGELMATLAGLVQAMGADGATPEHVLELNQFCTRADRVLQQRHRLIDKLGELCLEMTASLGDLAEDDSWAKGQMTAMRLTLEEGITTRGVRAVAEQLRQTRQHQGKLRDERGRARDALKGLIGQMLQELGDLGSRTGRFHENVGRYAATIDNAESLESLTGVVGEMLAETRSMQEIVGQTQQRLHIEHARAVGLSERVIELESELRRLSEEVSTDQLTQVANRRGLMQAFDTACARLERDGQPLAIGLLDIDNFKRLNDELGHTVGDEALRALAGAVGKALRPDDSVARFGGEEFVVLLPATTVVNGQDILTRLQRSLSVGLFMHERKTVLVTFSAGVTAYRPSEAIERALERADEALYEAKRTGKNRTCIG